YDRPCESLGSRIVVTAGVYLRKSHLICRDHKGNLVRSECRVFEEAGEHRLRHLGFNGQSIPHTFNLSERVSNMWSPRVLRHFVALSGAKPAFRGSNLELARHRWAPPLLTTPTR